MEFSEEMCIFAAVNLLSDEIMTAIALDRETSNYWEMIKGASNKAKLTLLTLISASMSGDEVVVTQKNPAKARRMSAMTDEQMEREMQGEPTPIMAAEETDPSDIVDANCGRIANGLEKWL